MALIECPECGGQLSDQAEMCPHCGWKPQQQASADQAPQTPTTTYVVQQEPQKSVGDSITSCGVAMTVFITIPLVLLFFTGL